MYKPDPQREDTAHSVSVMAGAGVEHEEIARTLGMSLELLRERFEDALTRGAYQRRREVLDAMYRAAVEGSVSAQKAYLMLGPKAAGPAVERGQQPKLKVVKPEPLGKKEQRQADAKVAQKGTDWEALLKVPAQ